MWHYLETNGANPNDNMTSHIRWYFLVPEKYKKCSIWYWRRLFRVSNSEFLNATCLFSKTYHIILAYKVCWIYHTCIICCSNHHVNLIQFHFQNHFFITDHFNNWYWFLLTYFLKQNLTRICNCINLGNYGQSVVFNFE